MLNRLDMLPRLGSEPAQFYALLKPVLGYFVDSFDDPSDLAVLSFWGRIVHRASGGSVPTYLWVDHSILLLGCGWHVPL
jgi:hypothetical protein